jgi:hypothetical protein
LREDESVRIVKKQKANKWAQGKRMVKAIERMW